MNTRSKTYIAGYRGMVGFAIIDNLKINSCFNYLILLRMQNHWAVCKYITENLMILPGHFYLLQECLEK